MNEEYRKYDFENAARAPREFARLWRSAQNWKARLAILAPPVVLLAVLGLLLLKG